MKESFLMGNQFKTTILLAILTAFILWVGNLLGGPQGMVIALIFAGGMNLISYWYSDRIVLKMYKAEEINENHRPELYGMVRDLSKQGGLPMPRVYIIPQDSPNAFATGRNPEHAVVAVTEGLLRIMNAEELKGVLAHELAHVNNRDTLIQTIAATLAGAVMVLASMARWSAIFGGFGRDENGGSGIFGLILMSILAPIAAMVIQMAISRSREYMADSTGAKFAGHSEGLARALEKLGTYTKKVPMDANPSTAHLFIVNPLSGGGLASLFSTHPPLEERIARLRGQRVSQASRGGKQNPESTGRPDMKDQAKSFWDRLSG
jgi:heat shock protein HtpX